MTSLISNAQDVKSIMNTEPLVNNQATSNVGDANKNTTQNNVITTNVTNADQASTGSQTSTNTESSNTTSQIKTDNNELLKIRSIPYKVEISDSENKIAESSLSEAATAVKNLYTSALPISQKVKSFTVNASNSILSKVGVSDKYLNQDSSIEISSPEVIAAGVNQSIKALGGNVPVLSTCTGIMGSVAGGTVYTLASIADELLKAFHII